MLLPSEVTVLPLNKETLRSLQSLLETMEHAESRFQEVQHQARLRRMYEVMLHPVGLFLAFTAVSVLTLIGVFASWRMTKRLPNLGTLQWSVTFGALVYYIPVLFWAYRREGSENWQPLLWEIHRADEIVLEQQWKPLLSWPEGHPESMLNDKAPQERIWKSITTRKEQIQAEVSRIRLGLEEKEHQERELAQAKQEEGSEGHRERTFIVKA